MTQYTPGPWTLQQLETRRKGYDWATFAVRSPANVCLAIVGEVDRYQSERIPANARLIAKAPQMDRTLTAAPDLPDDWPNEDAVAAFAEAYTAWKKDARAILAEIEGGKL